MESLSDRRASEAVRARIDWKYLLGLPLNDRGFDASVLCEFRARLLRAEAGELLFDRILKRLRQKGFLKKRGRQWTDGTYVLGSVRSLNRLELLGETVRAALKELAHQGPGWLSAHLQPEAFSRDSFTVDWDKKTVSCPAGKQSERWTDRAIAC